MKNKKTKYLLLFIGSILFLSGIIKLFVLSFDRGNFYPGYSSLRQGPSGTKILVESLKGLPGMDIKRNFRPLSRINEGANTAIFYLGAAKNTLYYDKDLLKEFERFMLNGGRVVISFYPVKKERYSFIPEDTTRIEYESTEQSRVYCNKAETGFPGKWGFDFDQMPVDTTADKNIVSAVPVEEFKEVSSSPVSWHTLLCFDKLTDAWKVLYKADGYPVIIERKFGKGSVVLVSDSYFFSNEAMFKERHVELLAYLVSSNKTVIFDETHFNIIESPGIVSLIKKYHMEGIFFGFLIILFLFVWKNSISLVPPDGSSEQYGPEILKENDAAEGFVNLLRKYIPLDNLIQVCVSEWKKSFKYNKKYYSKMESVRPRDAKTGKNNLLETYKNISIELKRKGKKYEF